MNKIIPFLFVSLFLVGSVSADALGRAEKGYWMTKPATRWHEAIPVGNGRLGAMTYGKAEQEDFIINEETVWGERRDKRLNPKGPKYLKEIRKLLFEGEQAKAEKVCIQKFMTRGPDKASYQPVGMVHMKCVLPAKGNSDEYKRGLLLDKGVSYTTFTRKGIRYRRETYVPYNGDVIVHSFTADQPGSISFTLSCDRPKNTAQIEVIGNNRLHLYGSTGKKGVSFDMLADVKIEGGKLETSGNTLKVIGADRARLLIAVETDYNMEDPLKPLTRDRIAACEKDLAIANAEGEKALLAQHIQAFSSLYNRFTLELPGSTTDYPPINELLAKAKKEGKFSSDLLLLYYDFCRYTLISSSKPGGFPATLQGIWNPSLNPAWNCDWHSNINISMFYWPATAWGLSETTEPLITLVRLCLDASRDVSKIMMGVDEGGFLLNSTDAWGATTPIRYPCYGMYVVGAAWLIQDAVAPWYATRDPERARQVLPLLRSQTQFFLGWLVKNPKTGKWVSGPSASPENTYVCKGGAASVDMGCSHDQILITATLKDFIRFAKMLTPDDPLIARAETVLKDLAQPQIAPDGSLQEWSQPFKEREPGHRHLSHTYGLMPGRLYSLYRTPDYAEAIHKSLQKRIKAHYHGMGWSFGWMSSLLIRLNQPEEALKTFDGASRYLCGNLFTSCVGSPQVADMNGIPAALNEMLVRNEEEFIEILPALPKRYASKGAFRGFCADRGFVLSAEWKDGKITALTVTSRLGGPCVLHYNGIEKKVDTRKGETIRVL